MKKPLSYVSKKLTVQISLLIFTLFHSVSQVSAQDGTGTAALQGVMQGFGAAFGDTPFTSVQATISAVVQFILLGAGIAAFVFILWGAFRYVTAGDDSAKTEAARKTITNAVVGLILVALSYVIWLIVVTLLGLDDVFGLV